MQSPKYEKLIKLDASRTKLGTFFDTVYINYDILAGKLKKPCRYSNSLCSIW